MVCSSLTQSVCRIIDVQSTLVCCQSMSVVSTRTRSTVSRSPPVQPVICLSVCLTYNRSCHIIRPLHWFIYLFYHFMLQTADVQKVRPLHGAQSPPLLMTSRLPWPRPSHGVTYQSYGARSVELMDQTSVMS